MKISGRLCINFTVDTDRYKKDYICFLYHVAKDAIEDYQDKDGITFVIEEDGYVELLHSNRELNA